MTETIEVKWIEHPVRLGAGGAPPLGWTMGNENAVIKREIVARRIVTHSECR